MIMTYSVSSANNSTIASLSPEHVYVSVYTHHPFPSIAYVSFEKYWKTEREGHLLMHHPSLSNGSSVFQSSGQVTLVWS